MQVVWSSRRGSRSIEHIGSAHDEACDALCTAYQALGFESVTQGDKVFRDLVLARIIEATSKADAMRVLAEVGVDTASYATVKRRLPIYAQPSWRQSLAAACARHAGLGPTSPRPEIVIAG